MLYLHIQILLLLTVNKNLLLFIKRILIFIVLFVKFMFYTNVHYP